MVHCMLKESIKNYSSCFSSFTLQAAAMATTVHSSVELAERVTMCCALFLAFLLLMSCCEYEESEFELMTWTRQMDKGKPCEEIYVVKEGETLHTISEKCGDPFIVEENPHIHDPDDVFPGLVIKITPFKNGLESSI